MKRMDSRVGEMFNLTGRTAIVTGGVGNLGSEYVKTLAQAGAKVAIFDISDNKNSELEELLKSGETLKIYKVDLTNKNEVEKTLAQASAELGVPTILINNAGLGSRPDAPASENGPFEDYPEESWNAMLDSHLKGMFFTSQAFIRNFRLAKKTSGSIINVSSTYGLVTPPQGMYDFRRQKGEIYYKPVGYSVAKSGVFNFTRWLAEYAAPFGLRVNTLVPGGVYEGNEALEFVKEYESRTILGRMARPHDFNGAVLFLASDASSYMTGSTLVVDGGWTAR